MSIVFEEVCFLNDAGKYETRKNVSWNDIESILLKLEKKSGWIELYMNSREVLNFRSDGGFFLIELSLFDQDVYRAIVNPCLKDDGTGKTYSMREGESELKYLTDHLDEAVVMVKKYLDTGQFVDLDPNKWMHA